MELNLYEIEYKKDLLFLNCPQCKQTPNFEFVKNDPDILIINCLNCQNKSEKNLSDYLLTLSKYDSLPELKCDKHNHFLDKFCQKCNKQFCSECDINNHNNCSPIKTISKEITKEKIEKIKTMIEITKEDFKKYIKSYMNEYLVNFEHDIQSAIIEALLKPYIQKMISFFHFCDCVLLNYNVEYPDYYQKTNMELIIPIFDKKINLKSINENDAESLFFYEENNYVKYAPKQINKQNNKGKLILYKINNNYKLPLSNSLHFNENIDIIGEYDGVKVYKNDVCSSIIKPKYYGERRFHKINNETFAIITKASFNETSIEVYSLKYNEIIYSSNFLAFKYILNLDIDTFNITTASWTDTNKIVDNKVIRISSKNTDNAHPGHFDAILIPNTNYFAILRRNVIDLYNKDDLSLIRTIQIECDVFKRFYKGNDDRIFLGGFKIGFFDVSNWIIRIIRDDGMKRFQGYLAGVENTLDYSDIVVTNSNNLVCIKYLKQVQRCTYDDVPDELIGENTDVCIFNFNAENYTTLLIESKRGLNPKGIYLNEKDEIVITCFNGIQIYKFE